MQNIFLENLDIIYFFYGSSFFIMGVAIIIYSSHQQKNRFYMSNILWLLGLFGILHGFHEWAEIFLMFRGNRFFLKEIDWIAVFSSYVFLALFALEFYNITENKKINITYTSLFFLIIVIFGVLVLINSNLVDFFSRYLLCLPSSFYIGKTSYKYYRKENKDFKNRALKNFFYIFASGFYLYSFSAGIVVKKDSFFPANLINTETFFQMFMFPVQILRMISAVIITWTIVNILRIFNQENNREVNYLLKEAIKIREELVIKTKQLEEANKTKSKFIANISHELKTPLNSILGFSEILIEESAGSINERQKEYLKNIEKSGRYLLRLILNILDVSKFESSRFELNISQFSVTKTIRESINSINSLILKKNIKIVEYIDFEQEYIFADFYKFQQIINNLLSNAIKFSNKSGKIEIRIKEYKVICNNLKYILIEVEDSGIGIKPEDQEKIFKEFVQLDTTVPGTGLGLAIAKKFIELHGGKIWVESKEGEGSTFKFTLPVLSCGCENIYYPVLQIIQLLGENQPYIFYCKVKNIDKVDLKIAAKYIILLKDRLNAFSRD
ncbi:MAG: HAMP domain-containing histidine kinase, partial [Candidatus Firestonebacteria bacterium]|nr:HAMP domain-containing histidine kinase [Candidatus Firestonebacteria bacterium]